MRAVAGRVLLKTLQLIMRVQIVFRPQLLKMAMASMDHAMTLLQISCADSVLQSEAKFVSFGTMDPDLIIFCGSSAFEVHRTIFSLASPVWKVLLNGPFCESMSSSSNSSSNAKITLNDDDPEDLMAAFDIIYSRLQGGGRMVRSAEVKGLSVIADKYDVKAIKEHLAEIKTTEHLQKSLRDIYRLEEQVATAGVQVATAGVQVAKYQKVWRCSQCKELVSLATIQSTRCIEMYHTGRYRCGYEHGWSCCSAKYKKDEGCKVRIEHDSHEDKS
jgi:hypothetical protein